MRVVEAAGLTLVPQTVEHAEEMFAVLSDPAIYRHENQPPASLDWLRKRFAMLESRQSRDGSEQWLNWVIRIPKGALIGFTQATVRRDGSAGIAYVLASAYWGRGLGRKAVAAMMGELGEHYAVNRFTAVLKGENVRSRHLLEQLGFSDASREELAKQQIEPGEIMMIRDR